MDLSPLPHHCPKCNALVVDRRSPVCTTCRTALPEDWIMTPEQASKVEAIDREARAEHASVMRILNPNGDPNTPFLFRQIDPNII
jgi:hypothetical protein